MPNDIQIQRIPPTNCLKPNRNDHRPSPIKVTANYFIKRDEQNKN